MIKLAAIIKRIGPLRFMLQTLAVVFVFLRLLGGEVVYSGWQMISSLIIPVVAPIVFFVMLLELLMSWVFMIDSEGDKRVRFRSIIKLDLLIITGLLLSWGSYFIALSR